MKTRVKILIFAAILLVSTGLVFGQTASRINFRKGAKQIVALGKLNSYKDKKVFVIRVKKGQTLRTEQIKGYSSLHYITVSIKNPTGEEVGDADASCNNRKEISPTEAGNYRILVFECQKADAWRGKFKLKISVR